MGSYFNRGASAGGHDEGDFNRKDITGPSGVGSGARGGPGPVADENRGIDEYDPVEGVSRIDETIEEPFTAERGRAHAASGEPKGPRIDPEPEKGGVTLDETAGTDSPVRADESYGRIMEDSESPRTGTS